MAHDSRSAREPGNVIMALLSTNCLTAVDRARGGHVPRIGSSDDPGDVEDEPFHLFASRYLLQQSLKSGNSVDTFLAIDTLTDDTVVLKSIVPGQNHDAARLRFEHETQVLRQLSGIGLTGLHDAGVAAGGTSIEDPPGERVGTNGALYLAYLRDPDGNKLCALHRVKPN